MEKTKKQVIYPQKFREAWKKDPKLKDWISECEVTPNKSYCIYCKCDLSSKYCDLINHAKSKKHLKSAVAAQQQQLTDSLPMIKNMANEMEEKIEYPTNKFEIETLDSDDIKTENAQFIRKNRKKKPVDYGQEIPIACIEPIELDGIDEEDTEIAEMLNLTENEFETVSAPTTLQEKRIKAEIEYFQQKTEYFAKLTENTKVHKTLMILQARKLNLEIKKMQEEY